MTLAIHETDNFGFIPKRSENDAIMRESSSLKRSSVCQKSDHHDDNKIKLPVVEEEINDDIDTSYCISVKSICFKKNKISNAAAKMQITTARDIRHNERRRRTQVARQAIQQQQKQQRKQLNIDELATDALYSSSNNNNNNRNDLCRKIAIIPKNLNNKRCKTKKKSVVGGKCINNTRHPGATYYIIRKQHEEMLHTIKEAYNEEMSIISGESSVLATGTFPAVIRRNRKKRLQHSNTNNYNNNNLSGLVQLKQSNHNYQNINSDTSVTSASTEDDSSSSWSSGVSEDCRATMKSTRCNNQFYSSSSFSEKDYNNNNPIVTTTISKDRTNVSENKNDAIIYNSLSCDSFYKLKIGKEQELDEENQLSNPDNVQVKEWDGSIQINRGKKETASLSCLRRNKFLLVFVFILIGCIGFLLHHYFSDYFNDVMEGNNSNTTNATDHDNIYSSHNKSIDSNTNVTGVDNKVGGSADANNKVDIITSSPTPVTVNTNDEVVANSTYTPSTSASTTSKSRYSPSSSASTTSTLASNDVVENDSTYTPSTSISTTSTPTTSNDVPETESLYFSSSSSSIYVHASDFDVIHDDTMNITWFPDNPFIYTTSASSTIMRSTDKNCQDLIQNNNNNNNNNINNNNVNNFVVNSNTDIMYCDERIFENGIGQYQIPIPYEQGTTTYQVILHFVEVHFTEPGKRIFGIDIENSQYTLDQLDIAQRAMNDTGKPNYVIVRIQVDNIHVTDGYLTIDLLPITNFPKINAIEIHPM